MCKYCWVIKKKTMQKNDCALWFEILSPYTYTTKGMDTNYKKLSYVFLTTKNNVPYKEHIHKMYKIN